MSKKIEKKNFIILSYVFFQGFIDNVIFIDYTFTIIYYLVYKIDLLLK